MDFVTGFVIAIVIGVAAFGVWWMFFRKRHDDGSIVVAPGSNAKPISVPEPAVTKYGYPYTPVSDAAMNVRPAVQHFYVDGVRYFYDGSGECWRRSVDDRRVFRDDIIRKLDGQRYESMGMPGNVQPVEYGGQRYYVNPQTQQAYGPTGMSVTDAILLTMLFNSFSTSHNTAFAHTQVAPEPRYDESLPSWRNPQPPVPSISEPVPAEPPPVERNAERDPGYTVTPLQDWDGGHKTTEMQPWDGREAERAAPRFDEPREERVSYTPQQDYTPSDYSGGGSSDSYSSSGDSGGGGTDD